MGGLRLWRCHCVRCSAIAVRGSGGSYDSGLGFLTMQGDFARSGGTRLEVRWLVVCELGSGCTGMDGYWM